MDPFSGSGSLHPQPSFAETSPEVEDEEFPIAGPPQPPAFPVLCPPELLLLPRLGSGTPTSKTRANLAWQGLVF